MENQNKHIDLSMNWQTAMKYLLVCVESHANKSFLEKNNGLSPRDAVRDLLQDCARVADIYVDLIRESEVE